MISTLTVKQSHRAGYLACAERSSQSLTDYRRLMVVSGK